jgi:predicted phage tail protein
MNLECLKQAVMVQLRLLMARGYFPDAIDVISGKTTSKYQRSYYVPLPAGSTWDIKLKRLTDDSTSSALINKTYWDSYTTIVDAKLTYPNSALIGVQIDAEQFNRIPVRGYENQRRKSKNTKQL